MQYLPKEAHLVKKLSAVTRTIQKEAHLSWKTSPCFLQSEVKSLYFPLYLESHISDLCFSADPTMSAADQLTELSRRFYEESKWKMVMSIVVASGNLIPIHSSSYPRHSLPLPLGSMLLLGFCTVSGGISTSMAALAADTSDSNQKSYYNAVSLFSYLSLALPYSLSLS